VREESKVDSDSLSKVTGSSKSNFMEVSQAYEASSYPQVMITPCGISTGKGPCLPADPRKGSRKHSSAFDSRRRMRCTGGKAAYRRDYGEHSANAGVEASEEPQKSFRPSAHDPPQVLHGAAETVADTHSASGHLAAATIHASPMA
jgi:hypothetical protein